MKIDAISCTLSSRDLTARGRRWRWLRDRAAGQVAVGTIPGGVRLRFPVGTGTEQELRELAALERECCSFADWVVTVDGDSTCLDVTSDGNAVAAIQSMFASFR
jgi:hypothetical protein